MLLWMWVAGVRRAGCWLFGVVEGLLGGFVSMMAGGLRRHFSEWLEMSLIVFVFRWAQCHSLCSRLGFPVSSNWGFWSICRCGLLYFGGGQLRLRCSVLLRYYPEEISRSDFTESLYAWSHPLSRLLISIFPFMWLARSVGLSSLYYIPWLNTIYYTGLCMS